jgi:hypothetical protein
VRRSNNACSLFESARFQGSLETVVFMSYKTSGHEPILKVGRLSGPILAYPIRESLGYDGMCRIRVVYLEHGPVVYFRYLCKGVTVD